MGEDIPEDAAANYFSVLRNRYRRAVVKILVEEDRPLDLSLLAGWIREAGEDIEEVEVKLHHIHLPRLEAAGLVSYSSERNVVEPTEGTKEAYALLQPF